MSTEPVDLDALLIGADTPRTFTRRDGTTGEMQECVIGDADGTARLIAWARTCSGISRPGSTIHIAGAKPDRRSEGRAYSIDETATVGLSDAVVTVPFAPLASVGDTGFYASDRRGKDRAGAPVVHLPGRDNLMGAQYPYW